MCNRSILYTIHIFVVSTLSSFHSYLLTYFWVRSKPYHSKKCACEPIAINLQRNVIFWCSIDIFNLNLCTNVNWSPQSSDTDCIEFFNYFLFDGKFKIGNYANANANEKQKNRNNRVLTLSNWNEKIATENSY